MAKFKGIFTSLFGDDKTDDLMDSLNDFNKSFFKGYTGHGSTEAGEAFNVDIDPQDTNIKSILKEFEIDATRMSRYASYDNIYSSLQLVKRIVTVYLNNIFQRDTVNNTIFTTRVHEEAGFTNYEVAESKKFVKQCIEFYDFERMFRDEIGVPLLKYGNSFVELVNLAETEAGDNPYGSRIPRVTGHSRGNRSKDGFKSSLNYTAESAYRDYSRNSKRDISMESKEHNGDEIIARYLDNMVEITVGGHPIPKGEIRCRLQEHNHRYGFDNDVSRASGGLFMDTMYTSTPVGPADTEEVNDYYSKFNHILFKHHSPHNIEIIKSPYGTVLGYIYNSETAGQSASGTSGSLQQMGNAPSSRTPGSTNVSASMQGVILGNTGENGENKKAVGALIDRIISNLLEKFDVEFDKGMDEQEYIDHIKKQIGGDMYDNIIRMLAESPDRELDKAMELRLIPIKSMYNFSVPGGDHKPYGRSIIEPLVYPGMLYLYNQLANMVHKVSRAALIRKWILDTGSRLDISNLTQQLKRQFKNSRYTAQDLLSTKSVPKLLSNFTDMITITKNGRSFVDMQLQETGDKNIAVADLEDARRELIALSAVPPAQLGFPEPIELKESLVQSNVGMATEVSTIQTTVNYNLSLMIRDIARITGFNTSAIEDKYNGIDSALTEPDFDRDKDGVIDNIPLATRVKMAANRKKDKERAANKAEADIDARSNGDGDSAIDKAGSSEKNDYNISESNGMGDIKDLHNMIDSSNTKSGQSNFTDPNKLVQVTLFPPIILTLQMVESSATTVLNLVNSLSQIDGLNIDVKAMLEKYVPYMDWEGLSESGDMLKTKRALKEGTPPEEEYNDRR